MSYLCDYHFYPASLSDKYAEAVLDFANMLEKSGRVLESVVAKVDESVRITFILPLPNSLENIENESYISDCLKSLIKESSIPPKIVFHESSDGLGA